jgi:hypothetical protein
MGHILFWYRKVMLFWALDAAEASKVPRFEFDSTNEHGALRVPLNKPRKVLVPAYAHHIRQLVPI